MCCLGIIMTIAKIKHLRLGIYRRIMQNVRMKGPIYYNVIYDICFIHNFRGSHRFGIHRIAEPISHTSMGTVKYYGEV